MRKVISTTILIATLLVSVQGYAKCISRHYGPTQPNERLWRIALKVCHDPMVIPQQVMLAIVKANLNAFNHANVNGLKSGYSLRIPNNQAFKRISPENAIMLVSKQNREWETGKFSSEAVMLKNIARKEINEPKTIKETKAIKESRKEITKATEIDEKPIAKVSTKSRAISKLKTDEAPKEDAVVSVPAAKTKTTVAEIAQQKQNTTSTTTTTTSSVQPQQELQIKQVANLDSIIQQNTNFQQQTNKRLDNLETQYQSLGVKIDQTQKSLQAISNNVMQMISRRAQSDTFYQYWVQIQDAIKTHGRNLLIALGLLMLMIISFVYLSRSKKPLAEPAPIQPRVVKEKEADYVPVESIASRLDLARAYIDMDDHEEARLALEEVLKSGTEEQKRDALELMAKINK